MGRSLFTVISATLVLQSCGTFTGPDVRDAAAEVREKASRVERTAERVCSLASRVDLPELEPVRELCERKARAQTCIDAFFKALAQ